MRGGLRLEFEATTSARQLRMIKEWPQKMQKIQAMLAYKGAEHLRKHLMGDLKGRQNKNYRQTLEVARVKGTPQGEYAYVVQQNSKSRFAKQIKVHGELLWVYATDRLARKSEAVKILVDHNPWTAESLPFKPDRRDAYMVSRKARPQEVYKTTRQRLRERAKWAPALQRVGVKVSRSTLLKVPKSVAVLPDVAMDALRQEFGLGGGKPKPSWRTGMIQLRRSGFKSIIKERAMFTSPMTNPSFTLWNRYPTKTKHAVTIPQVKRYKAFQDRIAPKGGGS